MKIIRKRLKTYRTYMECPECKQGFMMYNMTAVSGGKVILYRHICNKCGIEKAYEKTYPYDTQVEGIARVEDE